MYKTFQSFQGDDLPWVTDFDSELDLSGWDTSRVTDMTQMFWRAKNLNLNIGAWDTSKVTTMYQTFHEAAAPNADIGAWDTSRVTDMRSTFHKAAAFNPDIGGWDTSKVRNMMETFAGASAFNADIGAWDTSQVTNMRSTFYASAFNRPIGAWDVSSVGDMNAMFGQQIGSSLAFEQDLSGWCVTIDDPGTVFTGAPGCKTPNCGITFAPLDCGDCRMVGQTCSNVCSPGGLATCDACLVWDALWNGDGTSCAGCDGVANSGKVNDACGTCDGDGPSGCDNQCFSTKRFDECLVCGGTGIPEGECDCDGNVVDECGVCAGTGIPEGQCDCDGKVMDKCAVCGGKDACLDCAGVPNGAAVDEGCGCGAPGPSGCDLQCDSVMELDECGACGGTGIPEGACDCDGNVVDECGVCAGGGSSCADCAGVPNGKSFIDACGVCAPGSDDPRDHGGDEDAFGGPPFEGDGDDGGDDGGDEDPVDGDGPSDDADGPVDGIGFSSGGTPCGSNLECELGYMFCNAVAYDEEERLPGYLGFCESCDYDGGFADECTLARYTAVCKGDQDGDSVSGRRGIGSVEIVVPVVIGAVLLVAGAVCLRRKRTVRATQHRQSSMPTLGLDADLEE